jgi:hypothetical protein
MHAHGRTQPIAGPGQTHPINASVHDEAHDGEGARHGQGRYVIRGSAAQQAGAIEYPPQGALHVGGVGHHPFRNFLRYLHVFGTVMVKATACELFKCTGVQTSTRSTLNPDCCSEQHELALNPRGSETTSSAVRYCTTI